MLLYWASLSFILLHSRSQVLRYNAMRMSLMLIYVRPKHLAA